MKKCEIEYFVRFRGRRMKDHKRIGVVTGVCPKQTGVWVSGHCFLGNRFIPREDIIRIL